MFQILLRVTEGGGFGARGMWHGSKTYIGGGVCTGRLRGQLSSLERDIGTVYMN